MVHGSGPALVLPILRMMTQWGNRSQCSPWKSRADASRCEVGSPDEAAQRFALLDSVKSSTSLCTTKESLTCASGSFIIYGPICCFVQPQIDIVSAVVHIHIDRVEQNRAGRVRLFRRVISEWSSSSRGWYCLNSHLCTGMHYHSYLSISRQGIGKHPLSNHPNGLLPPHSASRSVRARSPLHQAKDPIHLPLVYLGNAHGQLVADRYGSGVKVFSLGQSW
jgi:hypothetical protein